MNRCYAPTHLSNKKLQKEILCDIQLSSLIFLVSYKTNFEKMNIAIPSFYIIYHFLTFFILLTFKVGDLNYRSVFILLRRYPWYVSRITAWKVSVFEVILLCIFSNSDWIRTRITPNTDTFCAVYTCNMYSTCWQT